ncbi:MAG: hypothetical protein ABTR92_19815 [Candidatus Accumulibacter phosphatis]
MDAAMQGVIHKMRADFALVSENRRAAGEWSDQDVSEIGAAIKAAIATNDAAMLACWSLWLADLSVWVMAWNLICRGSEARMREAARTHASAQENANG